MTRIYKAISIIALCALAFVLNGCGGSTPYSPIITQTSGADFTLTPANQSGNLQEFVASAKKYQAPGELFAQGTFNLTLTSVKGFAGTVNLSVTNPNSQDFQTNLPSNASLSSGGTAPVQLTIGAPRAIAPQDFTFTVTASSGSLSHSATILVHVVNGDFQITPASQ